MSLSEAIERNREREKEQKAFWYSEGVRVWDNGIFRMLDTIPVRYLNDYRAGMLDAQSKDSA